MDSVATQPTRARTFCLLRTRALLLIWGVSVMVIGVRPAVVAFGVETPPHLDTAERAAASVSTPAAMVKAPYQARCRLPSARIQFAAPAVGDLDHDPYQEIVVGTSDGWVYAVKADKPACTILWAFDTAKALNTRALTPSSATIRQAPAIADLDGDGWNEVVLPVGTVPSAQQNGGMLVLSHDGKLLPGWPQLTFDKYGAAYTEGIANAPAVADLDGDGKKEIIAGAFDHRIYAWHYDGSWVRGWPRHVFDTVWSSPAIGDLDRDGLMEVVIGVDAHADPYYGLIDGGAVYVFRNDGTVAEGFPKYVRHNLESTPALADLDRDGYLDIVIGNGSYFDWGLESYQVHAFDRHGSYLPGWPVVTGGHVMGSPAIADLDRDGQWDVTIGSGDGQFYAWRFDGLPLPGWPVTPTISSGVNYRQYSAVVANMDGAVNPDGKPELFINSGWEVIVVGANGDQLTWDGAFGNPQRKPTYWADWSLDATPVVADVDADGKLELIAGGGDGTDAIGGNAMLYIWKLADTKVSDAAIDWPMFKRTSDRASNAALVPKNDATIVRHNIPTHMLPGQSLRAQIVVRNTGLSPWSASTHYLGGSSNGSSIPARVELPPGSLIDPGDEITFEFTLIAPATSGFYTNHWRMAHNNSGFGSAIALSLKVGNAPAYYVLRATSAARGGGVYAGGPAAPIQPPADYESWERSCSFELTADRMGYYLLDKTGYITWAGRAFDVGSAVLAPPAVEIVLGPDRLGYYIMNAKGELQWGGGFMEIYPPAPTFEDERVRSFALTPDYKGVYVLDSNGQVYTGGTAQPLSPPVSAIAADSALKIKLTQDGEGYYILDRYGRLHHGGSAPVLQANYSSHVGEDWARDFELTEDESGYLMLDKFGGIHTGGRAYAAMQKPAPVWPDGSAVDLAIADSRLINTLTTNRSALTGLTTPSQPLKFAVQLSSTPATVNWRASADQLWLRLDTLAASTPGELVVTADMHGLRLGTYRAAITISGDRVANGPLTIPVQFQVVDQVHTLTLPLVAR